MAYFLGLVHGRPGPALDAELPVGYALNRVQLRDISPFMLYAPITLEHSGIFEAFEAAQKTASKKQLAPTPTEVKARLEKQAKSNPKHTIVGHVVDYFEVPNGGFYVVYHIYHQWPTVQWMITSGQSAGLSMTHCDVGNSIMPYEVSLCFEPARPHCYTIVGSHSLLGVLAYKRKLVSGNIQDYSTTLERPLSIKIMTDAESAMAVEGREPTPIESALSELPEEKQKIVKARLAAMMQLVDKRDGENAKLKEDLVAASKQNDNNRVQTELLKSQLQNVTAGLGKERCERYNLAPDVTDKAIESRDYDQLAQVTERALMACSRLLMEQSEKTSAPVAKREASEGQLVPEVAARIEETVAPTLTAASATAAPDKELSPDDYLARAMAATAQSFRGTPL